MPLAYEVNRKVPEQIGHIIAKLCHKNPEDRYISAWGIKDDFQVCWDAFYETGIIPLFELGKKDVSDKLKFPEKIYGRTAEIKFLSQELSSFVEGQKNNLVIVEGNGGVGKTSLVETFRNSLNQNKHIFIPKPIKKLFRLGPPLCQGWLKSKFLCRLVENCKSS